jgi:nicotinamidase-related amidase
MDDVPVSGTALLLIDVINDLAFEGSEALVSQAEPMALRLSTLKRRAAAAGVPVIYINDNFGKWRSDFRQTVAHCTSRSSPGRRVSRRLRPTSRDYFVLKPKHSGFFSTTLDLLLVHLGVRSVLMGGFATDICILFTANDAYMRDYRVIVPRDCVAANTRHKTEFTLGQIRDVLKGGTPSSRTLTVPALRALRRGRSR